MATYSDVDLPTLNGYDLLCKYRDLLEERSQNAGLLPPSREPLRRRYRTAVVRFQEESGAQHGGTGFLALVKSSTPMVVAITSADILRNMKKKHGDSVRFQCSTPGSEKLEAHVLYLPDEAGAAHPLAEHCIAILELTPPSMKSLKVTPLNLEASPTLPNWNCFCFGYQAGTQLPGVEVNSISYERNKTDAGFVRLLEQGKGRLMSGAPLCRLHRGHDVIAGMVYVAGEDKEAYLIPTDCILEIITSLSQLGLGSARPTASAAVSPLSAEPVRAIPTQTQPSSRPRLSQPPDDLEIEIAPASSGFTATFTYSVPGQQSEKRLAQGVQVNINYAALDATVNDPSAYGTELTRQFFEHPKAGEAWLSARSLARREGGGMRIRLRLDTRDASLHAIRWETLGDPQQNNEPLAKNETFPFSRYLEPDDIIMLDLPPRDDLRAAIVVASPNDSECFQRASIDVEAEVRHAQSMLGTTKPSTIVAHRAAHDPHATRERLLAALRDGAHVLYLVCHGGMVEDHGFVIWLEGPDGSHEWVRATDLATMIGGLSKRPLLAILLSCESAGNGYGPALSALGPLLAKAGIPAVLGFQGQITVQTVADLVRILLREVLEGNGEIDRALAAARTVLGESWWQPVLWLGTRDGRIWKAPSGKKATNARPGRF